MLDSLDKPLSEMDKVFKICLLIVLIGISISVSYYFIVAKPAADREQLKLAQEIQNKGKEKEQAFKECVVNADKYFNDSWDKWCENYGQDHMDKGCGLHESQSLKLTTLRKQDLETCYKLYGEQEN